MTAVTLFIFTFFSSLVLAAENDKLFSSHCDLHVDANANSKLIVVPPRTFASDVSSTFTDIKTSFCVHHNDHLVPSEYLLGVSTVRDFDDVDNTLFVKLDADVMTFGDMNAADIYKNTFVRTTNLCSRNVQDNLVQFTQLRTVLRLSSMFFIDGGADANCLLTFDIFNSDFDFAMVLTSIFVRVTAEVLDNSPVEKVNNAKLKMQLEQCTRELFKLRQRRGV
jgi:hypothetical protein